MKNNQLIKGYLDWRGVSFAKGKKEKKERIKVESEFSFRRINSVPLKILKTFYSNTGKFADIIGFNHPLNRKTLQELIDKKINIPCSYEIKNDGEVYFAKGHFNLNGFVDFFICPKNMDYPLATNAIFLNSSEGKYDKDFRNKLIDVILRHSK
jgi:hypothetical protein